MFELHITCTKDIETLKINFTDGTSVVTEPKPKAEKQEKKKSEKKETIDNVKENNYNEKEIDWSKYNSDKSAKEIVKPLDLPDIEDRPVKIDPVLNNLDF